MTSKLAGKVVVVVTGGSAGIGFGIAKRSRKKARGCLPEARR
jgi:NADP-dependent 3-hydroxy acid dehydrogenase YdfG